MFTDEQKYNIILQKQDLLTKITIENRYTNGIGLLFVYFEGKLMKAKYINIEDIDDHNIKKNIMIKKNNFIFFGYNDKYNKLIVIEKMLN